MNFKSLIPTIALRTEIHFTLFVHFFFLTPARRIIYIVTSVRFSVFILAENQL